jgi:hypothetical protein
VCILDHPIQIDLDILIYNKMLPQNKKNPPHGSGDE